MPKQAPSFNLSWTPDELENGGYDDIINIVKIAKKQKISILDDHAGKEITNEVQLKQLNNYFNGMSGDAVTGILTVINKNLPTMVNSANANSGTAGAARIIRSAHSLKSAFSQKLTLKKGELFLFCPA